MRSALFIAVGLALALAPAAPARAAPDSSMMQPVVRWIDAYNSGTPLPEDDFTDDSVIIDEFAPYIWSGKAGEHAWASAIDAFIKPGKQHVSVGVAQAFQTSLGGARATFVLPATLTFTGSRSGRRETQQALWLFVLIKSGGTWKIAADTWTIVSRSMANVTVPVRNEHGVLLVWAMLDGAGPLLFTFDPGAGDLYTSYARARLNGRAPKRVCLSSACFKTSMGYFDGNPASLFPRHDVSLGVIGGSIGPVLLQHYVAQIDYRASTLTLIPPAQFQPPSRARAFVLQPDSSGMPTIAAAVDGRPVRLELDIRAPTSMLFTPFLERSGLRRTYAGAPIVKRSGTLIAHAMHSTRMGDAELRDAAFWFSTASSGKFAAGDVAGLLGNNVLSHFVVTLDLPHRRAYLRSSASAN